MDTLWKIGITLCAGLLLVSGGLVWAAMDGDLDGDMSEAALVTEEDAQGWKDAARNLTEWNSTMP